MNKKYSAKCFIKIEISKILMFSGFVLFFKLRNKEKRKTDENSPAYVFGVVFYIIWKFSNLILGNALQPINNQLQHSEEMVNNKNNFVQLSTK